MITIDNTFLSLLLHPTAKAPLDPATGKPIYRLSERIGELIENLREDRQKVLIPTPALSEFLFLAGNDGPRYLADLDSDPVYRIGDFDQKAAVELASMNLDIRRQRSTRQRKRDDSGETKSKVTFDKQIVAIAIANDSTAIYSDDEGVEKFASYRMIKVIKTWELPLPTPKQIPLPDAPPKRKYVIPSEDEDEE